MKIRQGFVSNSSSSSFVVILPTEPYSAQDLSQKMLPSKRTLSKLTPEVQKLWKDAVELVWCEIQKAYLLYGQLLNLDIGLRLYDSLQISVWPRILIKGLKPIQSPWKKLNKLRQAQFDKDIHQNREIIDQKEEKIWEQADIQASKQVAIIWKRVLQYIKKHPEEYPDPRILEIKVEDHTPLGSFMEHKNIFRKFIYFQESNH